PTPRGSKLKTTKRTAEYKSYSHKGSVGWKNYKKRGCLAKSYLHQRRLLRQLRLRPKKLLRQVRRLPRSNPKALIRCLLVVWRIPGLSCEVPSVLEGVDGIDVLVPSDCLDSRKT